ncbi:MAG: hypothetical protein QM803_00950 [Rhodocyclaceae bacterium]
MNEKQVYAFDPNTGELVGGLCAQPDPVPLNTAQKEAYERVARPAQAAYDAAMKEADAAAALVEPTQWLLPANSTDLVPLPPRAGYAVVFGDGAWQYVEDHRLSRTWLTIDASEARFDELGPLPADVTPLEPPPFAIWDTSTQSWTVDEAVKTNALRAAMVDAVQDHLDRRAQALGYDDIKTAVSYAEEPSVPRFQIEARSLRAWRSAVWAHCYDVLDEVVAGRREVPTIAELTASLPTVEIAA